MKTKTIKIISLFLTIFFLAGFANNKKNTVIVETKKGEKVVLKDFHFGLKKTINPGRVIKKRKSSGGKDINEIYGETYTFYPQNKIQFKPGVTFGATWFVPELNKTDQIILKIQLEIPKPTKNVAKESTTSSFNKIITSHIKGADFIHLELEPGDPMGEYKIKIFNKGKLVASNVFLIKK